MGYYDPSIWIDLTDQLIVDIENNLRAQKTARQLRSRGRKSAVTEDTIRPFLPPNSFELEVLIEDSGDILSLREWVDTEGKISIDLVNNSEYCRKGHFKHIRWHHNPNGTDVPPSHIHFPTLKYNNLTRQHTYAYPANADNFIDALKIFCDYNNIGLHGITLPLLRG